MATTDKIEDSGQQGKPEDTFETDISETDEEGTSVRQAEVGADDLTEKKDVIDSQGT
jgi:hypothetical protein